MMRSGGYRHTPAFSRPVGSTVAPPFGTGSAVAVFLILQATVAFAGPRSIGVFFISMAFVSAACRRTPLPAVRSAVPILLLASITAFARAEHVADRFSVAVPLAGATVFLRFLWLILAADLLVSRFSLRTWLLDASLERRPPVSTIAKALWFLVTQLPESIQTLFEVRSALHVRGRLPLTLKLRALSFTAISRLWTLADERADALVIRGLSERLTERLAPAVKASSFQHAPVGSRVWSVRVWLITGLMVPLSVLELLVF